MAKVVKFSDLYKSIEAAKCGRSKWGNGVHFLALTIVGDYEANEPGTACELGELESTLLNGAANWSAYCYGGNLLICDQDIAELLCTPSELRRCTAKDGSLKDLNRREIWMDVQARAAAQAWRLIRDCAASCAETVYAVRDNEKGKVIFTGSRFACLCWRGKMENETGEFGLTSRFEVVPA
jgi:hypothetical protein